VRRSPIAALAAVAYAVILADLLTKLFAVALIGGGSLAVEGGVRLALVYNDAGAFGLSPRELGVEASTVVTFALILLMLRVCRELTAIDGRAPLMLGLITGAGAANHFDMLASPRGVSDFIALEFGALRGLVFNVADLALLAGLLLCVRTAWLLIARISEERSPAFAVAGGNGWSAASGPREPVARNLTEVASEPPLFREPEAALALQAAVDRTSSFSSSTASRREQPMMNGQRDPAHASRTRRPGGISALFALPTRFDRAATPALVIACTFILLYSLAIVWLPDAGRSAPSALLLALGVFGTVFVAVYLEMVLAERREARAVAQVESELADPVWHRGLLADASEASAAAELDEEVDRMVIDDSHPGRDASRRAEATPRPRDGEATGDSARDSA